ncbi:MAG: VWA domain-containing protein [Gemmatales bacterium]|nr:VWA domain-containing protein [Gemmatales bacterium]
MRRYPVWIEPVGENGTPMCRALRTAYTLLEDWVRQHPDSFPPILINITDGQPTDGDPIPEAQRIQQLATKDGYVLVFNVHISETKAAPIYYPDNESSLPDDYARMLFRMSSVLPPHMVQAAQQEKMPVTPASRGFVFNANMNDVIRFMNIGTRPKNLR